MEDRVILDAMDEFSITPTYVGVILYFDFYVTLMTFFSLHYDWIKI